MYLPGHFAETRVEELHRIIAAHPLGALVVHGAGGLDANHIPFLLHDAGGGACTLQAHVARANDLWREVGDGVPALVIFHGPEAYISPNWYPSKHEHHRQVPTWNYQAVHVHGTLRVRDDEQYLRGVVARLTRYHEARVGEQRPWRMTDSAPEFIERMISAIVGIEVDIERIVGKSKLSQNKDARDRESAARQLSTLGEDQTAAAMRATVKT